MSCNHEFRLLEKNSENSSYIFYCVKCLELKTRESMFFDEAGRHGNDD